MTENKNRLHVEQKDIKIIKLVNGQDIITSYDIVIPNEDFQANDQFYIGALVGQDTNSVVKEFHTILSDNTYWSITDASRNVDENNNEIE